MKFFATFLICLSSCVAMCQKYEVKIIDHSTGDTSYSYRIPGQFNAVSKTNSNGYTTTTGTINDPTDISYTVTGATFTLLLPDGRIAVVNCVSKYKPKGDYINRRSCRMPIVNEIEVEFSGKNAKLRWPVSLDGKKFESETYKILGVFSAAQSH